MSFSPRSLPLGMALALTLSSTASLLAQAPAFAPPAPGVVPGVEPSPLVIEPKSASELFDAARLMVNLGRIGLANSYLQQLLATNPDGEALLKLRDQYGTSVFLELTRVEGLEATSSTLLGKINAAVQSRADSPEFLIQTIANLHGSARQQAAATQELRHLGSRAVPALLKNLRDEPALLRQTLFALRDQAVGPMVGALQSADPEIQATAAEVLGTVGTPREQVFLLEPAFGGTRSQGVRQAAREALSKIRARESRVAVQGDAILATQALLRVARQHLDGSYEWPTAPGDTGEVSLWSWSGTELNQSRLTKRQASMRLAERLAREAALISPENDNTAMLVLAARLEQDAAAAGYLRLPEGPGTAVDVALRAGPELNARVLAYALEASVPGAALGSLQALSRNGSMALVDGRTANQPVIAALDSPHRRVQFAAAVTILHWEPTQPFEGSRRVVEILARALLAESAPGSVVMDPNVSRASDTAAQFGELGFRGTIAATGRDGFQIAATQGNIELAVLHPNVIRWELTQTLANLRADARTARLPVVIYGHASLKEKYSTISQRFNRVAFIEEVPRGSGTALYDQLAPLVAQLTPPPLSAGERVELAASAARWLRRIAIRNLGSVFDLSPAEEALIAAANRPETAADAIVALGGIPRGSVQPVLAQLASTPGGDPALREVAASELALHLERNGNGLREAELARLTTAYQQETGAGLRAALGGVLGALQPSPEAARREVLSSPTAPPPAPPAAGSPFAPAL